MSPVRVRRTRLYYVVVEIDGQKVKVKLTPDGKAIEISIEPGTRKLVIKTADGFILKTDGQQKIEIAAGKTHRIRAWIEKVSGKRKPGVEPRKGPGPWQPTPAQQEFFDAVVKLKPVQQIEAVRARLKLLNPGFDGKLEYQVEGGKMTELKLPQVMPEHLWQITALGTMERLAATGTAAADFPLLARLPLKQLWIDLELYNEPVAQVVRGMKTLETINGVPAVEFWKKFAAQRQEIEHFRRTAAAWSTVKRLAFVRRKLRELNPDFDGKLKSTIEQGRVVELWLITDQLFDISPVRALSGLDLNHLGPGHLGQHHRAGAHATAGAQHQAFFARLDFADGHHHAVGGAIGDRQAGGILMAHPFGDADQLMRLDQAIFGQAAIDGFSHQATFHPVAWIHQHPLARGPAAYPGTEFGNVPGDIKPANTRHVDLDAGHAPAGEHIMVVQGAGPHLHHHLSVTRPGIGEALPIDQLVHSPVPLQNHRSHVLPIS